MNPQRQGLPAGTRLGKWAGLTLGPFAAVVDQQVLVTLVYASCPAQSREWVTGVALICAFIAMAGAFLSLRVLRQLSTAATEVQQTLDLRARTDRFVALMSVLVAAMSLAFIVFGTPAGWILRCER